MPFLRLTPQRGILLVLLLCSALIFSRSIRLRPTLQLYLEMAAETSGPCKAQLYFDRGRGLNEGDSLQKTVPTRSLQDFRPVVFDLPGATIGQIRFDPMTTSGRVAVRRVQVLRQGKLFRSLKPGALLSSMDMADRKQQGDTVVFRTLPNANDPAIWLTLSQPLSTTWAFAPERLPAILAGEAVLLIGFFVGWSLWRSRAFLRVLQTLSERLTIDRFLIVDRLAAGFYLFCAISFVFCVAADLNGSSSSIHSRLYGEGVRDEPLLGTAREIRSDEWVYATPDVLSQALRTDRFQVYDSDLGAHSVALLGNVPVRHISELFRPQFWGFFVLPPDFGYSFFWQAKALLLVCGVFTWLLLLTGSSLWSIAGALWYFFSPFTQWTYSWPSALPEMTGLSCLACVCFCYLVTGQARTPLVLAGLGALMCSINFALCGYPPHLIPLAWLQVFVFAAWCLAHRQQIGDRGAIGLRVAVWSTVVLCLAIMGLLIYRDLHVAITAIAETSYPGRRSVAGGAFEAWRFITHFSPWKLTDSRFPVALGNISEGSGFLWLAPFCIATLPFVQLSRSKKCLLIAFFSIGILLFAWLTLPIPASIGAYMLLDRSPIGRPLPALGLANVALTALCMSACRPNPELSGRQVGLLAGSFVVATIGCFLILHAVDDKTASFFQPKEILVASTIAGALIAFIVSRQSYALAIALVAVHLSYFGMVNPVKRGMHVFLDSDLYRFIHSNPRFTRDRWLVFSPSIVRSGFVAGVGCEIYTGTRYLPDVDHFSNFRAHGYDVELLNRLGYLIAMPSQGQSLKLLNPIIVEWDVNPQDGLIKELGIHYLAFDSKPDPLLVSTLRPLNATPLDGFWLYEVP